jgi:hypothetical protein
MANLKSDSIQPPKVVPPPTKPDPALVTRTEGGRFAVGHAAYPNPLLPTYNNARKGKPKGLATVAQYLRDNVAPDDIAKFLIATMHNPAAKVSDRLQAARMILERRDGLIPQAVRLEGGPPRQLPDLQNVSDAGLTLIIETLRAATGAVDPESEIDDHEGPGNALGAIDVG